MKYRVYVLKAEFDSFLVEVEDDDDCWEVAEMELNRLRYGSGWEIDAVEPDDGNER